MMNVLKIRIPETDIDTIFLERWSPRAFSPEPIPQETLNKLFEAARWAPSSRNEQPWRFIYANTPDEIKKFSELLVDSNKIWASHAPVLAFAVAKKFFTRDNKPNRVALFETGSAWISLTLQARKLGLYTHGMGGIHLEKVYEVLEIPKEQYEVICAIAIGKMGDPNSLPDHLKERETPSLRKPVKEFAFKGKFQA